jgi:hypothetical protein
VTYILVAIAPDGTRKPVGREAWEPDGWSHSIAHGVTPHQMSRKRANQERGRLHFDGWDLKGHRVEVEPFVPQPATDPR